MNRVDIFHATLHFALTLAAIPLAMDPLSAGFASALIIEGDHKVKGQGWERTFRDLLIRLLGVFVGAIVAALTGNLPVF